MSVWGTPRRMVLTTGLVRGALGLAAALVPASAIARTVGRHPRGDGVLWDPGGEWLVEALWHARSNEPKLLWGLGGLAFVALAAWSVPLGALVASRAPGRPVPSAEAWGRALRCVGRLTWIAVVASVLQALALVLVSLLVGFGSGLVVAGSAAGRPFLWGALLGAMLALAIGGWADLARARVVWDDEGAGQASARAGRWGRRALGAVFLGVAKRVVLTAVVLSASGAAVVRLAPQWPIAAVLTGLGAAVALTAARSHWFKGLAETHRTTEPAP